MSDLISKSTRTFGRRQGRPIKDAKQHLMEEFLPTVSIELPENSCLVNPDIYFNRKASIWFEVGFGGGEHLAHLAEHHPHINFIGCEPFMNGVASLVNHLNERKLTNVQIFQGNAIDLLKSFGLETLERFYLMFADPWPKKRHHKRRFIQPDILNIVIPKIAIGAEFRLATDHESYQTWMLQHLRNRSELAEVLCTFEKPSDWPNTRYEAKAIEEGRKPMYMIYKRIK